MLTPAINLWTLQRNSPWSFVLNGQILQSFNSTVPCCWTSWFLKRQLLHYTHFISHYVFSSSLGSIVLSLPSCSQPFHLFRSHLCHTHSAPHSHSASLLFSFFSPAHLSFIFDPFFPLGHWSLWLSPCSLLNSILPNSSISFLSLAWPFLSVFASATGLLTNIKNLSSLSFLFLSLSGLYVVSFLSICLSLCPTDHPVGPSARLY